METLITVGTIRSCAKTSAGTPPFRRAPTSNLRSRVCGFTLIELLVTLTVVAILSLIAVPSYRNFVESGRLTTATNDFVADLNYARIEAMKRQGATPFQVVVCASTNGSTCAPAPAGWESGWVVFWDDGDGNYTAGTSDVLLKIHDPLPTTLTATASPAGTAVLTFNRLGFFNSSMTSLTITDAKTNQNRLICLSGGTGRAMVANGGVTCP